MRIMVLPCAREGPSGTRDNEHEAEKGASGIVKAEWFHFFRRRIRAEPIAVAGLLIVWNENEGVCLR